jgi:glycosyltransferase involved in cell wall biosynthesis
MFQYAIDMDVSRPIEIADETVALACMFRHFNRSPIRFGHGADGRDEALSLGYRLFNGRSRQLLHEGRLAPSVPVAKPEQWLPFELTLPSDILSEDGEFEIVVDLVMNGEDWLHERGHSGSRFALHFADARADARTEPVRAGAIAAPVAGATPTTPRTEEAGDAAGGLVERAGPGFADMLKAFDFSDYGVVRKLERGDPRGARDMALPAALLARFNAPTPVSHDTRYALTALMDYVMRKRGEPVDRLIGKRTGRFDLIRQFFDVSHQLAGAPGDYFPPDLVAELNAYALSDGLFELPLSRLMLWHWLSENRLVTPDMAGERDNIFWWWVTSAMPAHKVPDVFIPQPVIAHLGGVHDSFRGRTVEISRFAFRAYAESEGMRQRYDLKTTAGLIAYGFDFVIHNAANRINRHFIGSSAREYWAQPFMAGGVGFTRFEMALIGALPPLRAALEDKPASDALRKARAFLDERIPAAAPEWLPFCALAPDETAQKPPLATVSQRRAARARPGAAPADAIMVAGLVGSPSGLGVNLKMSCQTFEAIGSPMAIYDVQRRKLATSTPGLEADAALLHINADMVGEALAHDLGGVLARKRRIGFFLWELDVLPRTHVFGASLVDEIWAPTQFVAELYASIPGVTVKLVKKFITMPEVGPEAARAPGRFRFLTSFDFHSGVERKNPFAVVRAFRDAFPPGDHDVGLTIKTTEYVPGHWGDANNQWQIIQEAAAQDPRIAIVVDAMPERDFFRLIRAHDCIVSSHRAEGFGYLPAYALAYRKPVIVTDYSGTRDFCTAETAYPVSCRMTPVRAHEFIIDVPGARWAEIDHEHLVETMRRVRDDRADGQRRAARGAKLIAQEYSLAAQAARYREALEW